MEFESSAVCIQVLDIYLYILCIIIFLPVSGLKTKNYLCFFDLLQYFFHF